MRPIARSVRLSGKVRLEIVERLTEAVGFDGLVTGQHNDLNGRDAPVTMFELETLNAQKTGVLFEVALEMGGRIAGLGKRDLASLRMVAFHLGLAYQIADDLFDCTVGGHQRPALKDTNKDQGKPTVVTLIGVEEARDLVGYHLEQALQFLPIRTDGMQALRHYITLTFGQQRAC